MKSTLYWDPDFRLWVLLHLTRDAISRTREQELRPYGISTREFAVLFIIETNGGKATTAEISRWLFRRAHSVSGLVSRMEKRGLLRKVRDKERKNRIGIVLTEKGKQAYNKSSNIAGISRILACLSEEDCEQLGLYLQRLQDKAFKELGIHHKLPFPPS